MHRVNPIPINSHINYVFKAFWRAQHSLAADDFRRSVQIAECFQLYNRIAIEFLNIVFSPKCAPSKLFRLRVYVRIAPKYSPCATALTYLISEHNSTCGVCQKFANSPSHHGYFRIYETCQNEPFWLKSYNFGYFWLPTTDHITMRWPFGKSRSYTYAMCAAKNARCLMCGIQIISTVHVGEMCVGVMVNRQ